MWYADLFPQLRRVGRPGKVAPVFHTRNIFVDPGLGGTGVAIFPDLVVGDPRPPIASQVLRGNGKQSHWLDAVTVITTKFVALIDTQAPIRSCVVEFPEFWAESSKSYAGVAGRRKGEPPSLFKLTYLIGALGVVCGCRPILVQPARWKGQLTKEIVKLRILAVWPELGDLRDHETDAIGMGLAAQGGLCRGKD